MTPQQERFSFVCSCCIIQIIKGETIMNCAEQAFNGLVADDTSETKTANPQRVTISFNCREVPVEKLFEIEQQLKALGIRFDTGYMIADEQRDWSFTVGDHETYNVRIY